MLSNNISLYGLKVLLELITDILYFPLWWYSQGLFYFSKKLLLFLRDMQKTLALGVWIKNIFRPMYQQTDWQGRLISVFIRLVQIILRSIVMLFWIIICLVFLLAWIALPFYIFYQIFFQLFLR